MREFPYILVSKDSFDKGAQQVVHSNISVINLLRASEVADNELCPDAFTSYCVDYLYSELTQESLASFIHKTKWDNELIEIIHAGLTAIGDPEFLEYFEKQMRKVKALSKVKLNKFLSMPFEANTLISQELNDTSFTNFTQDLRELNAKWLLNHPDLKIAEIDEMQQIITEFLTEDNNN